MKETRRSRGGGGGEEGRRVVIYAQFRKGRGEQVRLKGEVYIRGRRKISREEGESDRAGVTVR